MRLLNAFAGLSLLLASAATSTVSAQCPPDTEAPVIINMPDDITGTADAGLCGTTVSWDLPTATDNCEVAYFHADQVPNDFYAVGITTVTYTAMDAEGNISANSFTITITDDEDPSISDMPADISVNNDSGDCSAVVTWDAPSSDDNCGIGSFTSNHDSGDSFPVGTTTVTYTATDVNGSSVTASFDITVTDNEDPTIAGTPANITQTADNGDCAALVTWTPPTSADNCSTTLTSTHNPGDSFNVGSTTVTYTSTDASGNVATSSFTVTVTDNEGPVIAQMTGISATNDADNCSAVVTWTDPAVTDNCANSTLTPDIASGTAFDVGVTAVTYTATDIHGNSSTMSFNVTVTDTQDPVISDMPDDIIQAADAGVCSAVVNWTEPTAADNCTTDALGNPANITLSSSPASGSSFDLGTTTVTYTAIDIYGNTTTSTFTVTINNSDSDSDGICDNADNCSDTNACNYADPANAACETPVGCDTCSDGTGTGHVVDNDADDDGTCDSADGCPNDPAKTEPGICGCGNVDTDVDSDGVCDDSDNCTDTGACNYAAADNATCDTPTGCDTCSDATGTGSTVDNDADDDGTCDSADGCPNDPAKTEPGICGCGNVDTDVDSDGVCDDSDNCTDTSACNYAAADNATCDTPTGCDTCSDATGTGSSVDNDSDDDGTCDSADGCPDDPAKTEPGLCGCGNIDTDVDSDGLCDDSDNCTDLSACNYAAADNAACDTPAGCETCSDATGTGTIVDNDADDDGTCDSADGCPNDPAKTEPGVCGCGNVDNDVDSDGVCDDNDNCTDISACNYAAADNAACDTPTGCDTCSDATGTGSTVNNDADADGTCDSDDNCSNTNACNYADSSNDACIFAVGCETCINSDGTGGAEVNDSDNDGICDGTDNCSDTNACNYAAADNAACDTPTGCDTCSDATGTGATVDNDADDDGTCDSADGCPNDPFKTEPGLCGCGNVDTDVDSDGVCDDSDNCTDISACNFDDLANGPCQVLDECDVCGGTGIPAGDCDCDGNQLDALNVCGGTCAADADGDGICDDSDNCTDISACNFDDLANGPCQVLDECDVCGGTGIPAGDCDCDGNQLDALNVCGGTCAADADGDGICDDSDNCTDISACNYADPSNDACINPDGCETCSNSDGTGGVDANDDDGDGTCNADDGCPNDPFKTEPGLCGCGYVDTDVDSDGVCDDSDNCTDLSACNYAAADNAACDTPIGCDTCSDATGTGTIVDNDADDDGTCDSADGCPNDPAKTEPGACGCGNVDNDADDDGVCDSDEITGCTDASACNYDSTPTTDTDNTLCTYTVDPCDTCSGATDGTGTVLDNDADNDGTCDSTDGCPNDPAKTAPGVCGCGNVDTDVDSDGVCDDNDLCTDPLANNYQSPGGEECAPCPNAPIFNGISPVTAATTMTSSDGAISLDITGNPATMLVLEGINGAPNYTIALPDALDDLQAGYYIAKVQDDDGCWGVDGTSPGGTTLQQPAVCLELIIPFDLCCSGCGINDTDADGICDDDDNCTDQTAPNFADPANTDCEP